MKQLKTTELTGYEPIDQKLIAGYDLFDRVELDSSVSVAQAIDNLGTPDSILTDLYDLEKTNLKLAKSILCKRFYYRELRFAEGIFITSEAYPPITLTAESKKYNIEREFLNKYLYCDDKQQLEHAKDYIHMLKLAVITERLDTASPLIKHLMTMMLIVSLIALLTYPLIGNNVIIIMLIITYASINLVRNITTLAELELEDFSFHYE